MWIYRKAIENDYAQIVELEKNNMGDVLTSEEKRDGFLSGMIYETELEKLNQNLAVIVCIENERVLGFICAGTTEFKQSLPLPAAMIACYPRIKFEGRSLNDWKSFSAGPICIDKNHREKGIFEGLYKKLLETVSEDFELVITLISKKNTRSMKAHQKVGLQIISTFEYDAKEFYILAMPISKPST